MIIIHCLKKSVYESIKDQDFYGEDLIEKDGFIHASEFKTFIYVAPAFNDVEEELLFLCIETEKVKPEIKWEVGDSRGTKYPHIYGALNMDAIVSVMPYNKDENNHWVMGGCCHK